MIAEELFQDCVKILEDRSILEEDQADRISELIASRASLAGPPLEKEVVDVLWRHRNKSEPFWSSPPRSSHIKIVRRPSPAPWQLELRANTPTPSQSGTPPLGGFPSSLRGSPFPSPRPSPRLANALPIPYSQASAFGNSYEDAFSYEQPSHLDTSSDWGYDAVSWLVGDDNPTSYPEQSELSPHDMIRSVLGVDNRSDEEIDNTLQACGYDLGATLAILINTEDCSPDAPRSIDSGSPSPEKMRSIAPRNSNIVCRYYQTGNCLRADCRFSHDLGTTICKFWLMGRKCLAGEACLFSHDPLTAVSKMTLDPTPPQPQFLLQDDHSFTGVPYEPVTEGIGNTANGFSSKLSATATEFKMSNSRPSSRQQSHDRSSTIPAVDDTDAFPALTNSTSSPKKNELLQNNIPTGPSLLADVVRNTPSPGPSSRRHASPSGNRWRSPSAKRTTRIPSPQRLPWLEKGNKQYLMYRKEASNQLVIRNEALSKANSTWRNDEDAAKEWSRKAALANIEMSKAQRAAARALYEERTRDADKGVEIYVELQGYRPEEAIKFLEEALSAHQNHSKPIYVVVGTIHNGKKDKLSRSVRVFLDKWKYAYREFVLPDKHVGILGIEPSSFRESGNAEATKSTTASGLESHGGRDIPRSPGRKK